MSVSVSYVIMFGLCWLPRIDVIFWIPVNGFFVSFVGCGHFFFICILGRCGCWLSENRNHWTFFFFCSSILLNICSCCYAARCAECDNLHSFWFRCFSSSLLLLLLPVAYYTQLKHQSQIVFSLVCIDSRSNAKFPYETWELLRLIFHVWFYLISSIEICFVAEKLCLCFESKGNLAEKKHSRSRCRTNVNNRKKKKNDPTRILL